MEHLCHVALAVHSPKSIDVPGDDGFHIYRYFIVKYLVVLSYFSKTLSLMLLLSKIYVFCRRQSSKIKRNY